MAPASRLRSPAVPVIVVHGIQGSWLKDEYPVDYQNEILWTGVLRKNFKALHLHPNDSSVDAEARRLVGPHQAVPLIYENLVDEIREEHEDNPYVYAFTYDWRKDNRLAAAALADFVQRIVHVAGVHERSKKPARAKPKRVTLVGHSMGGLVIKWYVTKILGSARAGRMIDKVITIATPYRGSLKAVEALLPGARNLFGVENKKSMRHAARTMPGIYQLLPSWRGAVVKLSDRTPLDVFDPRNWQRNLLDSLEKKFPRAGFFARMIADAKAFTTSMKRPWPTALRQRVFAAYGVDTATWRQVPVDTAKKNFYRFDKASEDGSVKGKSGGDGTVHAVSSMRTELGETHLLADQSTKIRDFLAGHHANMPNHSHVQDWILHVLDLNPYVHARFESPF